MTEFTFSDNELRLAAISARNAILASLPEPESCNPEFSNTFLEKMNMLLRLDQKRTVHKKRIRRLVVAILALMVAAAALITFHPTVRATVQKWVRTVFGNAVVYRFTADQPPVQLPQYTINWLPDDYEQTESYSLDRSYSATYINQAEDRILIVWYIMSDGVFSVQMYENDSSYIVTDCSVRGMPAHYYEIKNSSHPNELIWFDEASGVVFHIRSHLSQDELLRIAESIRAS